MISDNRFSPTSEFQSPCNISLVSDIETASSRGQLSKAWYVIDGELCLVKGNSIHLGEIGWEPYSEVMSYKLANLLGFNCIPYYLMTRSRFKVVHTHLLEHVSVCKNFIAEGCSTISLHEYGKLSSSKTKGIDYMTLIKGKTFEADIYKLLAFDALIGNPDRHANNIELETTADGTMRLAPIFDSGAALLAWIPEDQLFEASAENGFDTAKPFFKTHAEQLQLIPLKILRQYFDLITIDVLLDAIAEELALLPRNRALAIRHYLKWRLKRIKEML